MDEGRGKSGKPASGAGGHLRLGQNGEAYARRYLEERGYRFLEKNWRFRHLEIDLIFEVGEEIVFVEVKTRSSNIYGGAREAVTSRKRNCLLQAAEAWLQARNFWERPCRFDVICLTGKDGSYLAEHYINAFDAG